MKFQIQRVGLSGGYDSRGRYWGTGMPLWWYCSEDHSADEYIRSASREAVKAHIRQWCPTARFYR